MNEYKAAKSGTYYYIKSIPMFHKMCAHTKENRKQ